MSRKNRNPSRSIRQREDASLKSPIYPRGDLAMDPHAPITLREACAMIFRDTITVATLRAEARRGNLVTYGIGRKIFTTVNDIEEMKQR